MDAVVRPITLGDIAGFRASVSAVIAERIYLASLHPFSLLRTAAFVAENLEVGNPQFVADAGGEIVGWCDVRRETIDSYAHTGILAMGVIAPWRGRGVGERLIRTALDAARAAGFEKIELSVYASNTRARGLYEKVGFVLEGTRVRGRKVGDEYDDVHMMGLLLDR
ncbi:MAG TPA: GNAT family N-acetyltransferase [Casimicrobiaceae bacterium]|nr:GNAT family N-acetyltransferase [Casimicrobiaceae bacterium]